MGAETAIEWCHATFNPWIGCTKVHAGCKGCYAETLATTRLGRKWGPGAERRVTSEGNWKLPLRWARAAAKAGERRRVFCASLADVLDEEAPPEAQARLWDLIRETALLRSDGMPLAMSGFQPGLDWLLLTKRPERWELIPADVRPLVWLGTSISDQATADEWVPRLLAAEGFRLRFLSVEPMLGPVCLEPWLKGWSGKSSGLPAPLGDALEALPDLPGIDWVIVGGESGHHARPFPMEAGLALLRQCRAAGVATFFKQTGAKPYDAAGPWLVTGKGGEPREWPPAFRVRQFPEVPRVP